MKKILFLLLLSCIPAFSQNIITAVVTVTNAVGTINGETITLNGATRTWTNSVNNINTQILTNNSLAGSASNLFVAYSVVTAPNMNVLRQSTNAVVFRSFVGFPNVVSLSSGWATVTLSTNTLTQAISIRAPASAAGATETTNSTTAIVDYLNSDKTLSQVHAGTIALSNLVDNSSVQTVTGAKQFTGANVYSNSTQIFSGGFITNVVVTNFTQLNGSNFGLYGGWATFLTVTNLSSPGAGSASLQVGVSAVASGNNSTAYGVSSTASGSGSTAIGISATASGNSSFATAGATASGLGDIAIGPVSSSTLGSGVALGAFAANLFTNSTSIGQHAASTSTNQVRLGTSTESVSIPGTLQVDGGASNLIHLGWATFNNQIRVTEFNNTSLANGANANISTSTNSYVTIATGPTGAFTINGIAAGVNGQTLTVENTTAQAMTIANESGVDPAAANRIKTGTGADYTLSNNPGCISFRYNGTLSRWVLTSHN